MDLRFALFLLTRIITTQVVVCWLGILFGAPWRGNLRIAQGRAKRRPGYSRPSPAFALQGQKRKNQRLLFVHTLHLLYMLLPLQGESTAHCIHHPGRRFALPWAMRRLPCGAHRRHHSTHNYHPAGHRRHHSTHILHPAKLVFLQKTT